MASTAAPPITLEEYSRLPDDGYRHELNAAELIATPPVKLSHTIIAQNIQERLSAYLKQRGDARALTEAGYVLSRTPLTVRQPDISC
jgi:Uma2 family endonuclease